MNAKQRLFALEYLIDLNATRAATRAGYSARTANEQGARLLANASVRDAIAVAMEERAKRTEVTADRVVLELARLGFTNLSDVSSWTEETLDLVPSAELTPDQAAAVKEVRIVKTVTRGKDDYEQTRVEQRITMHDKKGALDSLARHLGMFVDRSQVEHGGEIVVRHTPHIGAVDVDSRPA